jgi:hypothetical protein
MYITKTDYLEYTYCKKNLWLKKHKPELFEGVELSEFEKKIIQEGNDADEAARNLFPKGELVNIVGVNAVPITKKLIESKIPVIFQGAFLEDEFFIQADILVFNDTLDGWELYEVKASNDVKRVVPHHHVNDLAFQKTVIEKSGVKIVKAGVIHLNGEYRKGKKVNYHELFTIAELTDEVLSAELEVQEQMNDLKAYLHEPEQKGCGCLYRGQNAQCTTFNYSNPEVPEYSVHNINRIGASKKLFYDWIDRGIYTLDDIDNPEKLTGAKKAQYDAYKLGKPVVDRKAIKDALNSLVFPLQFFDYEGYSSAIPRFDNFGAYEQIPFQYSLHILHESGELEHKEFLITEPESDLTLPLIERMKKDFDEKGSVISWYKSYEAQRNNKLAELHPKHAQFLEAINDRMFDLYEIFAKSYYVDARFMGSASIKKVLPVIVPELTYANLNISKGDQATEQWEKMIFGNLSKIEKDEISSNLLEYCKLDTLAMVRIYEFLKKI